MITHIMLNTKTQVNTSVAVNTNINEMKKKAASMHTELLELISTLSDGTVSDKSSSVCHQVGFGLPKAHQLHTQVYHGANGSRNRWVVSNRAGMSSPVFKRFGG
jgi:hypothetical protein